MKRLSIHLAFCGLLLLSSCNGQDKTTPANTKAEPNVTQNQPHPPQVGPFNNSDPSGQISPFVRRIFQDKNGDMWFGTNGDGVIHYNGNSLAYFSLAEGFTGVAVRSIVEDKAGNLWFGTNQGISRYKPEAEGQVSFTNYTEADGLVNNDVWSMTMDRHGRLWVGTLQGVSVFDGQHFSDFKLPETTPDSSRGVTSSRIVHHILEDSHGRMWFGTNGGAFIYDAAQTGTENELSQLTEKDGLCNNMVNSILEDQHGNFWFATHHNGICRWNGQSFTHFGEEDGVYGTEAWSLYEDRSGNIWFPTEGHGVYRYNDEAGFTNFNESTGLASRAVQCIFEDRQGRIWCGGWLGLYRYDPSAGKTKVNSFVNLTQELPWD